MSYSNVYFDHRHSEIHYWEYNNGVKEHKTAPAPLFFYVAQPDSTEETGYTTIYGEPAKRIQCEKWREYKDTVERYKDMGMDIYESDVPVETKFIIEHYLNSNLKPPNFDIHYLDIEVHSEEGFPKPEQADFPITIITVWSTKDKKFYVFAEKNFNVDFITKEGEEVQKYIFDTEEKLLSNYLQWTRRKHPDFLSGWNSNGYDIPYIMNRAEKILGEGESKKISPVGVVREREVTLKSGKSQQRFMIGGISTIDMLEVFKNYTFSQRSSWKLDDVAEDELGEKKIAYVGTLADLYNNDWQKYAEYNVQDVRLLRKLEEKKGFLNILTAFCYGCHVPFDFYQKTVRVLDGAFLSELAKECVVLPDVDRDDEGGKFPGGFVKDPIQGLHEWTVSFDATSLYPSIMMGWNISPETKIGKLKESSVVKIREALGDGVITNTTVFTEDDEEMELQEVVDLIKAGNYCMAGNGALYTQDKVGVVPRFVKEWFNKRKNYKKQMLVAKAAGDKEAEQTYDNLQLNYKILINSVYGYLSTKYSRFYDLDNAMGVTLTGQSITKQVAEVVEHYFANEWVNHPLASKREAHNFDGAAIYCDTDSIYVDVGQILDSLRIKYRDSTDDDEMDKVIGFINKHIAPFISDYIQDSMDHLSTKSYNCKENHIFFKRESIARRSFFIEKKKYVMWEVNGEGDIKVDKLKATGVDLVRSSTPPLAKKYMKEYVFELLKKVDRNLFIERIRSVRKEFLQADVAQIAFPSTANNMIDWGLRREREGKFKSTPQHIKGSILYNQAIKDRPNLATKYDLIYEGDKIKFVLMKPGPLWRYNILSYKDKWIDELGIDNYIDRERQYERAFFNPLKRFFELLKWDVPNLSSNDLSAFFDFGD